jgi:hypothetical protein
MAEALHEAYGDLFTIKAKPTDADKAQIKGKFKSTHNVSDEVAKRMMNTFYALLELADLEALEKPKPTKPEPLIEEKPEEKPKPTKPEPKLISPPGLHYNIQIHLPATKDIEVFNAIFKSLKEHLLE